MYRRTRFEKSACELRGVAKGSHQLSWDGGFVDLASMAFQAPAELFFRSTHDAIVFSRRERPRSAQMWHEGKLIQDGLLPERHVHVIPAGSEVRGWLGPGEPEILTVYLDPAYTRQTLLQGVSGDVEFDPYFGAGTALVWELADALRGEFSADGAHSPAYVRSIGQLMAVYATRHHARVSSERILRAGALDRSKLHTALDYMQDHIAGNPSLAEIAAACGLSPYHFSRSFKKATGYSPFQWITYRKVSLAQDLLKSSDVTVREIAERYGFGSASDFTRTFKKVAGITPVRFRDLAGGRGSDNPADGPAD